MYEMQFCPFLLNDLYNWRLPSLKLTEFIQGKVLKEFCKSACYSIHSRVWPKFKGIKK